MPKCEKCFVKQADCDNHFRDVHKFVCRVKGCSVYKYNNIELHEHMRYDHWSQIIFRWDKCVKVFSTRSELHQHHKVDHGTVKRADVQGEKYPCLRCHRQFLSKSMFVSHSRDHEENVYACNECLWHFNTIAGLIKHCRDTHDERHYAWTTYGEVFGNNSNIHLGATVCSREGMIEDKRAQEHATKQLHKEFQKKQRKKKKKKKYQDDDDDDNEDDDKMYHPSQDYSDDSWVDPEFRPTREELRKAN